MRPCTRPDAHARERRAQGRRGLLRRLGAQLIGLLDQRTHPVRLAAGAAGLHDARDHLRAALLGDHDGLHRRAPGGSSSITEMSRSAYAVIASVRGIGVAVMISWCGTRPCLLPLLLQPQALLHAEAVLLVDDDEREVLRTRCPPGTARACRPRCAPRPRRSSASALRRVRAGCDPDSSATVSPSGANQSLEVAPVLLGEQLGRRHERRLQPRAGGARGRRRGDHRLAAADIALQQARHRYAGGEIAPRPPRARAPARASARTAAPQESARARLRRIAERERRIALAACACAACSAR